jgi:hypothetical protein
VSKLYKGYVIIIILKILLHFNPKYARLHRSPEQSTPVSD